jgi:antitoxin ParD1/3/4
MLVTLQPDQEQFIQAQLATGRYTSAAEVIAEALHLLEKRNDYVSLRGGANRWGEDLRTKIDMAAAQLDRGEGIDGETAISQLRAKLHKTREA